MRTSIALCLALFLAACGGSDKPAASNTTPESGESGETGETGETPAIMTADECEAGGGTVVWDPGDGSGQCNAGFFESGHVSGGDEGGLCCQQMPDNAE